MRCALGTAPWPAVPKVLRFAEAIHGIHTRQSISVLCQA